MLWPRSWSLSAICPPFVPLVFALAVPPNLGRHVSGVRLALYPPRVGFGGASKRCVSHVALCVRHVSAPCLFFVLSLSARCSLFYPLFVSFWPGLWFGFGRVFVSFVSALWFCAFVCFVSVVVGLIVEVFVATPLPAVRLVTLSRQCSCLPSSFAAHLQLHPVFHFPPFVLHSLSGSCLRLPVSRSLYRAWPCGLGGATPKPPFSGSLVMLHALLVFSMTSVFWSVTRAGAHALSCLKTVWGLCWCNSPNSLLWGSPLQNKGWSQYALAASPELVRHVSALIPLWPRLHTLSAMCPPCVRHVSAMCPLCVPSSPPFVFHVSALPPCVCLLCLPFVCPPCVRSLSDRPLSAQVGVPASLCPLLACCGAGPWHHEVKLFLSIVQPAAFLFHARWSVVSFFSIHFGSANSAFASAPYA